MKHLESGWNSVFHGHETHCFMPMKHLESGTVTTEIYIFLYWFFVHGVSLRCFMLFHCCFIAVSCCFIAVSLLFHCCFIAVSLLFYAVSLLFSCCFIAVSRCFIALFHGVLRCFIFLFHPVSWPWNRCSGNEPLGVWFCFHSCWQFFYIVPTELKQCYRSGQLSATCLRASCVCVFVCHEIHDYARTNGLTWKHQFLHTYSRW